MKIETVFSCGDTAFVVDGHWGSEICEYTVGMVQVCVTNSAGDPNSMFDNYKPQTGYSEEVMCDETGIGSGSVWRVGLNAFKTMDEAVLGQAAIRAEHAEAIERQRQYEAGRKAKDIERHKRELARLMSDESPK